LGLLIPTPPYSGVLRRPVESKQYTALTFGKKLEEAGVVPSMSRVGSALDNAISESFVSTLKSEIGVSRYPSRQAARASVFEAVVPGFLYQVGRALRRGVLQSYREEDDSLMAVRGRLRMADQIRKRFGVSPPAEVTYDEFTEDIEENRLIKAALERLGRMRLRTASLHRSLGRFDAALEMVQSVSYDPRQLPEVSYTRLNEHYRPAVELARVILRASSIELRHGTTRVSAFLMDMNDVFQDFTIVALREALGLSQYSFPNEVRGHPLYLDKRRRIALRPDISWWERDTPLFVGDVKYKEISAGGVIRSDLYQLLSYVVACDLPGGLLIYGSAEGVTVHEVVHDNKHLEVAGVDLSRPPEAILQQIEHLARWVRYLRSNAKRPIPSA
jgi:5-methylcytosine-specific restriction enzyme subunit McrC